MPQLRGRAGKAKSYAERLFDYPEMGPLSEPAARLALEKPAEDQGVKFNRDAVDAIVMRTGGYPYFLQEWGKHSWGVAKSTPITLKDVESASAQATWTDAKQCDQQGNDLEP